MGTSDKQGKLYSFYESVITVLCFAVCLYLFFVCFTGTFRLISDIGYNRVLFLNPLFILLVASVAVITAGIYAYRSQKLMGTLAGLEDERNFGRAMTILKAVMFLVCVLLAAIVFGMRQRVDQYSIQYSAYGLSWNVTEVLTPPRHLGVYPNNVGIVLALYLLSFITGHYNNAVIMLIFSAIVPFIYSDLAEIGGKFGMSRKSQIAVMVCGLLFLPLLLKVTFIYGDIPGLFFAVRAMKHASDIAMKKSTVRSVAVVIAFTAVAYAFKNNYLIFAIAIMIYLAAEFLRQRRFRELYIPVAVIAAPVLLNSCLKVITGALLGGTVSSGASKFSWIAMGMQENAGTFNGYNDATYYETGFDVSVQTEQSKREIAGRLNEFLTNPNQALGFYIRKIMVQWSDPTFNAFEFSSRNVYLYNSASPLLWAVSDPAVIRIEASFLKVFQILIYLGGGAVSVKEMREKKGTPVLLLITTFIGGYFFHIIWEAGPSYAMPYMVVLIPAGVAGMIHLIKILSGLDPKKMMKTRTRISASGMVFFITGALVFLLAAAGIGTVRHILIEGRDEYRSYFGETLSRSREPVAEGKYRLVSAVDGSGDEGIAVELVRYAGKYRMKVDIDGIVEEIYLTNDRGKIKVDWCSYDETQAFVIVKNPDGTYSICQGISGALRKDPENGITVDEFVDYTYRFNEPDYHEFISEHPDYTWNLVPAV